MDRKVYECDLIPAAGADLDAVVRAVPRAIPAGGSAMSVRIRPVGLGVTRIKVEVLAIRPPEGFCSELVNALEAVPGISSTSLESVSEYRSVGF